MSDYLPLYLDGQILNPGNPFFKDHIMNIRTSIRINGKILKQYNDDHIADKSRQTIINEYLLDFKTFIDKYQTYINANYLQSRISKSLQQLMKNFLNISQLSHCFDAEKILGKAFKSLIHNMEYIFDHAAAVKTSDVEQALNKFRNVMGSYLSDLICSDKLFIEGQTLTHPSIGSATKLLFAYNSLINTIMEKLIALENNPIGDFTFLVISGGCDKTIAADLFEFLGIQSDCTKLIIITIPEMSLYDVKGTLFRLLHECMHFCGERKRKVRYKYFIRAIANTTARNFAAIFYNDNELDKLLNLINPYFDPKSEDYKNLKVSIQSVFYQCSDRLADEIADRINSDPFLRNTEKTYQKRPHIICQKSRTPY